MNMLDMTNAVRSFGAAGQVLRFACLALALSALPQRVCGQTPASWDPRSLQLTRTELTELRDRYQSVLASPAYSRALKSQAEAETRRISERLEQGDFRTGDRIILRVEGEKGIPDTLLVEPGPEVILPVMGSVKLSGVLRSELQEHMEREISRFIQNPVLEARSLIRVSVQGNVGSPGFYVLPADLLLGDVIMAAGGPGSTADLSKLEIRRGEEVIMDGKALEQATIEGRSLDQLNVRAGDALIVPTKQTQSYLSRFGRYALIIASSLLLGIRIM